MRYLIALLCPPLAILMCGRVFLCLISIPLCFLYFPSALLALLVVAAYYEDHHYDRFITASLGIERSYMKIWKSHLNVVNESIREDTRAVRDERMRARQAAKAQASHVTAQAPPPPRAAPRPPRRPLITRQGIESARLMIVEMATLTRDQSVAAYRSLPEWAQPITWGLAAGTPVSLVFVLVMILRR